jgi:cell division protease FtsH
MDGFETDTNVIVLAATNRADVLDPALLRPGRFDRRTNITLPERQDREAILQVHFKKKPTDNSVKIDKLAAKTAGSSGADLANIANEAAIIAARRNAKKISDADLTEAFEKVAIGPERKARVMNDAEKRMTAYHEGGHAIVGHILPDSDPVHKVTIIPRGGTGGVTWFLPPEDKRYTNVYEFKDILARAMGGRVAEKVIYGDDAVTTGAGSDLRKATEIARDMIIEQGMGTKLRDQVFHEDNGGMVFDKMTHDRPYSDATAEVIDQEVKGLIQEASRRAEAVIADPHNRGVLDTLVEALMDKETLDEDEAAEILKEATLPKEAMLRAA